jgi:hypothetical protein
LTEEDNFPCCIDLTLPDSLNIITADSGGISRNRKRKDRMGSLISRVKTNLSAKHNISKYPTFDDELLRLRDTLTTLHNNISTSSANTTASPRHKTKKKPIPRWKILRKDYNTISLFQIAFLVPRKIP